jgi:hypothetical protein
MKDDRMGAISSMPAVREVRSECEIYLEIPKEGYCLEDSGIN